MSEFGFSCPAQLLDRHIQAIGRVNQMRRESGQPLLQASVGENVSDASNLPGQYNCTDNVWVGLQVESTLSDERTLALGAITLEVMTIGREIEAGVVNRPWRGPLIGLQEL